jgi:hypothetical protein
MQEIWIKKSLCLLCLSVAAVAMAQSSTPSILDRVQKVDDPELGELIRAAIENRKNFDQKDALEIIRKVTLGYVQIKLLDQQIAEVSRKINAETGPTEMRYELLMAKTELESKLMAELANLREVMGVIPKHAFGQQPISTLNAWVHFHVLGQRVYVLDTQKPFYEYWGFWRLQPSGLLSESETLDYVRGRLKDKNSLPIRIDIYHTKAMSGSAEYLRSRIVSLVRETKSQMETEVRLELITWAGSGESTFYIREGKIRVLHAAVVQRPDGGSRPLVTGLVEPNDLEQHILWRLTYPGNIPLTFRIEYDKASTELAKETADMARAVVKHLGLDELVDVAEIPVEPVPEVAFLGRWQGIGTDQIQRIDIQLGGVCLLTPGGGSESTQAGATVTCPWLPTTKEIIIDPKELGMIGPNRYVYRGCINADGNLIIEKGLIYPQGSFHRSGDSWMIFERMR